MYRVISLFFTATALLITVNHATAEEQQGAGGPPPMLVATAEVVAGKAEPMTDFVGTVYFSRTAKVAAEVEEAAQDEATLEAWARRRKTASPAMAAAPTSSNTVAAPGPRPGN